MPFKYIFTTSFGHKKLVFTSLEDREHKKNWKSFVKTVGKTGKKNQFLRSFVFPIGIDWQSIAEYRTKN